MGRAHLSWRTCSWGWRKHAPKLLINFHQKNRKVWFLLTSLLVLGFFVVHFCYYFVYPINQSLFMHYYQRGYQIYWTWNQTSIYFLHFLTQQLNIHWNMITITRVIISLVVRMSNCHILTVPTFHSLCLAVLLTSFFYDKASNSHILKSLAWDTKFQ